MYTRYKCKRMKSRHVGVCKISGFPLNVCRGVVDDTVILYVTVGSPLRFRWPLPCACVDRLLKTQKQQNSSTICFVSHQSHVFLRLRPENSNGGYIYSIYYCNAAERYIVF